ncbi:MAG TPA: hypothetical protein VF635_04090 [Propionibacteriaceae bacterium]
MTRRRWWTKTRGLPVDAHASWTSSLLAHPARQVRILAWATTPDGFAIGSPAALSLSPGSEAAGAQPDEWRHVGWHEVERGGWDADTSRLGWVLYGGERGSVELVEPGRLPEVFRERVAASIVLERSVPILNRRSVLISARRDLAAGDGEITWNTTLGRGLSWQGEGVRAAVDEAVQQVRTEYDLG